MGSDDLKERLLDAVEGNLEESEQRRFEEALARDPEAGKQYQDLSHIVELMKSAPLDQVPPDFTASVMDRLEPVRQPLPIRVWRALMRPRTIKINLMGALSGAVAVAILLIVLSSGVTRHDVNLTSAVQDSGKEYVIQFVYHNPRAKQVFVSGSFNNWEKQELPMTDVTGAGSWVRAIHLTPGVYEYMFLVDGQWVSDQLAPYHKDDGFGKRNAILKLGSDNDAAI